MNQTTKNWIGIKDLVYWGWMLTNCIFPLEWHGNCLNAKPLKIPGFDLMKWNPRISCQMSSSARSPKICKNIWITRSADWEHEDFVVFLGRFTNHNWWVCCLKIPRTFWMCLEVLEASIWEILDDIGYFKCISVQRKSWSIIILVSSSFNWNCQKH